VRLRILQRLVGKQAAGGRKRAALHDLNQLSWLIPIAFFAVALALRLYRLDAQSLWLDEGSSWQMARQPWPTLLRDMLNPTAAYPLYHLLLKVWIIVFGDSEIALRLPSVLAGATAVSVIYLAAYEGLRESSAPPKNPFLYPMAAAAIVLLGPFPIWYAQEAKTYSVLLLAAALLSWALLRALRTGEKRDWLVFASIALVAIFVHRLAALTVLAGGWAWWIHSRTTTNNQRPMIGGQDNLSARVLVIRRWSLRLRSGQAFGGLTLASAGLVLGMTYGLGSDQAATGAYIPAGPLSALGLTFTRFSLDRWPGDLPWWWILPWAVLLVWGFIRLAGDVFRPTNTLDRADRARLWDRSRSWDRSRLWDRARSVPTGVLCLLFVPLGIFVVQLMFTRLYEARYLMVVYPAWVLALAYPLADEQRTTNDKQQMQTPGSNHWSLVIGRWSLLGLALATSVASLLQPTFGLFSGAPVKEQYREAIAELAARVQPDDAVVIHPAYIRPLYDYYMRRLNTDPALEPIVFADFWQGETSFGQREWDLERRQKLVGYTRSFLLIAPEHARTVDPPAADTGDEYGLVGNFWAFSREQRTWPCGIWRYNGAHLFCQEAPEAYITGVRPEPVTPVGATFGNNLKLLGFTLKASTPQGPGVYRAGGNLPISLFWDVGQQPDQDLSFFLHLCQDCEFPPLASDDGPPLEGYLPTSSWLPGKPARDDRTIQLPRDLQPGSYTLLLGVYRPSDPTPNARLTVSGDEILGNDRLILATIEIVNGE
jgi:mannosyltransferase